MQVFNEFATLPIAARASHVDSLILFLNRWGCRFESKTPATLARTRRALSRWIDRESASLAALARLNLIDPELLERCGECRRLYESLLALKGGKVPQIRSMSDAAASKILHLMVPPLFVMWDKKIKKGIPQYEDFLRRMHRFALRLHGLAPQKARPHIDGYLQRTLGYAVRKPLTKYIDEYDSATVRGW